MGWCHGRSLLIQSRHKEAIYMAEPAIISHWYKLIEGLDHSSQDFYKALEDNIKNRKIPEIGDMRIVNLSQGGIFSGKRDYLRVYRGEYTFDVCAAPFGTGFFVSSWLYYQPGCLGTLADIPPFSFAIQRYIRPMTYYRHDTMLMFQTAVQSAVHEMVDSIATAKGLRALTELERKPMMKEFYKR